MEELENSGFKLYRSFTRLDALLRLVELRLEELERRILLIESTLRRAS